jgi:imidazolonepropionase-like amidohydrolase
MTMMTMRWLVVSASILGLTACQAERTPDTVNPAVVVIEGATLIDGVHQEPIEDAVLVVAGDTILRVGSRNSVEIPTNAQTVNAAGKTIIPGMFNLHGHIANTEGMKQSWEWWMGFESTGVDYYSRERIQRDANAYLYYGITHMASLGNDQEPMIGFLAEQRAGKLGGARLYWAGSGFAPKDGWMPNNPHLNRPTTPDEARKLVQQEVLKNPDLIKIWVDDRRGRWPKLTPDLYEAIIDEAHKHGLKVMAHMHYLEDSKELIRRGLDGLAHSVQDKEVDDEFLRLAKENGVTQITTLVGHSVPLAYADGPDFLDDPGLPVLFLADVLETVGSKEYQERWANSPTIGKTRELYKIAARNAAKIAAAGIPIAIGSDSGPPGRFQGLFEHREMELLVKAGLTPMQVIQAATINGAKFLGLEDKYGTLEPGKIADFIILNATPLEDLRNSRKIDSVWMNGRLIDRTALPLSTATSE